MEKNYTFNTPVHVLSQLRKLLNIILILIFLLSTNEAISQRNKRKTDKKADRKENKKRDNDDDKDDEDDRIFENDWNWKDDRHWKDDEKDKKLKKISLTSCITDMGNGLFRVSFGYNNPNNRVVKVKKKSSYVVIKRKGKKYRKNEKIPGIKIFQPGEVKEAFFIEFYDKESVEWRLKFPKGKKQKAKVDANSPMCPEPPVIIPVYGQEFGKSTTSLGLELTALAQGNAGDEPSKIIYQLKGTGDAREVLLEIVPKIGRETQVRSLLGTTFGRQYLPNDPLNTDFIVDPQMVIDGDLATFDVFVPINRLLELNNYPLDINFIRPLYIPIRQEGVALTQGDAAMFTNAVRESFVLERDEDGTPIRFPDGQGVTIGVISDSYDKQLAGPGQPSRATVDVQNRDLPGDLDTEGNVVFESPSNVQNGVKVLKDYPYGVASDEGRAMLQLIHDVAPGADLAFSTGVLSPRDFALAIEDLALAGCDFIVDDVTYPFAPFFGEGQISDAIKAFTNGEGNEGHAYFTSAGNFANRAYQSVFRASALSPETNIPALETAKAHVFSSIGAPEDVLQGISVVPGTYMIVLQWDEPLASQDNNSTGASTDLDIYLVDDGGNFIVGNNRVNINGDAAEVLVFQATGTGTANILITSPTDPGPVPIRYIAFRTTSDAGTNGLEFTEYIGAPTVSGHAMTSEAITVGAVDYRNASAPAAQAFSSFGGALTNLPAQLLQVDIAAPDGGNTTVLSIGNDITADADTFPNFFGTSAAAPHAAASFALLKSTLPAWYPEGGLPIEVDVETNLEADQLLQLFKSTSLSTGSTDTAGSGLINAEAAFQQIAAQTAFLTGFTVATEVGWEPVMGLDTLNIVITGKYIQPGASVSLGGQELAIVGEPTDTEIMATVVPFVGNPKLTVLNNSELPGAGKSNGLNILPDGQITLKIIADDIAIAFGNTPQFTYKVQGLPGYEEVVFGLPEGETLNSVLAELGLQVLPEIKLASTASGLFPDAGFYSITPGFIDEGGAPLELTEEQLAAYQVVLVPGTLTISTTNLIVAPQDISIVYGEAVTVQLNYFDENEEPLGPALEEAIRNAHAADFYQDEGNDNTLLLINKLRAVVNAEDILGLLNDGSSWMASDRIIQNKLRAVVNGEMNLIDLDVKNFDNYFDITEPIGNKLRAVVNKLRAVVNGQDLLNGTMQLQLIPENAEEEAIPNKLRAVVNGTGLLNQEGDTEFGAYEKIFAVVDFEDGNPTDEGGDPEGDPNFNKVYATNLLSSLDVTVGEEISKVYPGAILSNLGINFNTQYRSANLTVSPANLFVQTPDVAIDFGVGITREYINSLISPVPVEGCESCPASLEFEGFVYGETVESVFADPACNPEELPDGEVCSTLIPYYFEDIFTYEKYYIEDAGEEGLMLPASRYFIKIGNPQNYVLDFGEGIGELTIASNTFSLVGNNDGEPYEITYGNAISPYALDDFTDIVGLDEGQYDTLFPFEEATERRAIPYIFEEVDNAENIVRLGDPIAVGSYYIKIDTEAVAGLENYTINYEAILIVTPANLFYETPYLAIDFGVGITREYIDSLISPVPVEGCEVCPEDSLYFEGFEYDDTVESVFADPGCNPEELVEGEFCPIVIPYYFEDVFTYEKYYIADAGEDGLMLPASRYFIRIGDPQNYVLDSGEGIGLLTIESNTFSLVGNNDGEPYEIEYGNTISPYTLDELTDIVGLDEGKFSTLFPFENATERRAIPYVLEAVDNAENKVRPGDLMDVGSYLVKIDTVGAPRLYNYTIDYEATLIVTVTNKVLTVNSDYFDNDGGPYGIEYGETENWRTFLDNNILIDGLDEGEEERAFPDGIPYYLVDADLEGTEAEVKYFVSGNNDEEEEELRLPAGQYVVRVDATESNYEIEYGFYLLTVNVSKKLLIFNADLLQREYGEVITEDDIQKFHNPTESLIPVLQGFAYDENEFDLFNEGIPYVLEPLGGGSIIPLGERLDANVYTLRIEFGAVGNLQNYTISYQDDEGDNNIFEITKATLFACIQSPDLQYGELLTPDLINSTILGYKYDDDEGNVFPGGVISYAMVEDLGGDERITVIPEEGLVVGEASYFIRILDDNIDNYTVVDGEDCEEMEGTSFEDACVSYFNPISNSLELTRQPEVTGVATINVLAMDLSLIRTFIFDESEPIIIDLGSEEAGMYVIQTRFAGGCQSDFIVIKE